MSASYAFIRAEKAFPVRRGCLLLGVSTSGYYTWRDRPASATTTRRDAIAAAALVMHTASDGVYGYRKVYRDLVEDGTATSLGVVRRVMREQDLHGTSPRAYRVTTHRDPGAAAAPDLLERDFRSSLPGTKLVGDITYLRTWSGWG